MKLSPIFATTMLLGLFGMAPLMSQTILVEYKFNGGSLSASNVNNAITATALSSSKTSMVAGSASSNNLYYLLRNGSGVDLPQSQASALEGDVYVSMSLQVTSNPVSLGTMTFDFGNYGTAFTMDAYTFATVTIGGVTTVYTASVYDTITMITAPYYSGRTAAMATDTFGQATIDFGGLEVNGSAEIRLYTWYENLQRPSGSGGLPSGTAYSLRVDNIVLSTHAIPEPHLMEFALLGVIALALRSRRS